MGFNGIQWDLMVMFMSFHGISLAPTQPWMGREKPLGNEHLDPENHQFFWGGT